MTDQEMADHLLRHGWRVQPPTKENCPHTHSIGKGTLDQMDWYCRDCGKTWTTNVSEAGR